MNMDALLKIKADVQGENNIRRFGNSLQGLQGQAKNAALSFNTFKTAIGGVAAAIAGSVIVGGLAAIVKKSIDAGDELFNLQAKSGIAANALIGIGNAAKLADVDMATLGKGITKLNVNLVKAAEGNEDLARKFQALGIEVKTADGQIVPADKALKQIADRFADMPDGAQKTAAAVALFGKAGADLIPLLNEGAASMDKFSYKIGEDFAARSDLFNDTITEFGIKTQGFALELTDALLPALQSILEVFGDLFDTKQDWTALFDVIIGGFRAVAAVTYATIKLVDVLIKSNVAYYTAIGKVLKGDFAGAADIAKNTIASLVNQAGRDFAQIQKIFTNAPSPGTGRRAGGRNMDLDTSAADAKAEAEAKRRAAEAKKRAGEAETLQDRINGLIDKGNDFTRSLTRKTQDLNDAYKGVGATPVQQIFNDRAEALKNNTRNINDLIGQLSKYRTELEEVGMGKLFSKEYFGNLLGGLAAAQNKFDDATQLQSFKDLLPTLDDYNLKIKEIQDSKRELTAVEQLNNQINLLQLDTLALANPALAEHIRLLRERAGVLDQATQKQKDDDKSFGANFTAKFKSYYDSIANLGAQVGDAVVNTFKGLEDVLTDFVTTGKANFADLAKSIIADIARIAIKQAIIKPLMGGIGDFFGIKLSAKGNVFAQNGIQAFARGGVVDKPTLFPFAKGTGLMGEAGPEAIMPLKRGADGKLGVAADMTAAMARYQRQGGGSGASGNSSSDAMGDGAAATPVLSMSFETTRFLGQDYVSTDQLQAAMMATERRAAAAGAKAGAAQVTSKLQQSPSYRRQVGLR